MIVSFIEGDIMMMVQMIIKVEVIMEKSRLESLEGYDRNLS